MKLTKKIMLFEDFSASASDKQNAQASAPTANGGSSNLAQKLVDSNREGSVKLLDALNMLTRKMETQNNLTRQVISTVEQYS